LGVIVRVLKEKGGQETCVRHEDFNRRGREHRLFILNLGDVSRGIKLLADRTSLAGTGYLEGATLRGGEMMGGFK